MPEHKRHTGGTPKKGTPEYDAWRNSPAYEALSQKRRENAIRLWDDPEFRQRREFGPETREQMSQRAQERWDRDNPEYREYRESVSVGFFKPGQTPHNKDVPLSDKQKAKLDRTGATLSNEHKAKIGASSMGNTYAKGGRGRKGQKTSDEAKRKQSIAKKGKPQTEEQKIARFKGLHKINGSSLEDAYALYLEAQGVAYQRQYQIGYYHVDFYIESENRVIEIAGCFWHGCEQCGYTNERAVKARKRDARRLAYICHKGYAVDVIWEHDLPKK